MAVNLKTQSRWLLLPDRAALLPDRAALLHKYSPWLPGSPLAGRTELWLLTSLVLSESLLARPRMCRPQKLIQEWARGAMTPPFYGLWRTQLEAVARTTCLQWMQFVFVGKLWRMITHRIEKQSWYFFGLISWRSVYFLNSWKNI